LTRVHVTYPPFSRTEVVEKLRRASVGLEKKLPLARVVLFGSFARDQFTAASDVDLLVVYKGRERPDAYKIVMDNVRLPRLEPRIYTEQQFDHLMAESPKFAEVLRKEGITIFRERREPWSREAKTG
jgi:predicted nucleotidyltransferase